MKQTMPSKKRDEKEIIESHQINISYETKINQIQILKNRTTIKNSIEFLEEIEEKSPDFIKHTRNNKYKFYWLSNNHPDEVNYRNPNELEWSPYDEEDCIFLEFWYQKFLKGDLSVPRIGDYIIDFDAMLQYHYQYTNRQRLIKRQIPNTVINMYRKNRYDKNFQFNIYKPVIFDSIETSSTYKKLGIEFKNYQISNNFVEINFNVIRSIINLKFRVQSEFLPFISNIVNMDFSSFMNKLKIELNKVASSLNKFNFYRIEYLNQINEENFFESIIKMYSAEGFLYKYLNKLLREKDYPNFEKIKLYYVSLLASYEYFSSISPENLLNDNIPNSTRNSIENMNEFDVYRGAYITNEEIYEYSKINENNKIIRIINEFYSTSLKKQEAEKFMENCLIKLKINFRSQNTRKSFAYLFNGLGVFDEKEVLLRSGSVIILESYSKIKENNKNIHIIEGKVLSCNIDNFYDLSFPGKEIYLYNSYLGRNPLNIKELSNALMENKTINLLDLKFNDLGVIDLNMKYLSVALQENKTLTYLDLSSNSLGKNHNNCKYLSEAIKVNKSLKELYLWSNNLGDNPMNLKYLSDALMVNTTLTKLDLSDNSIGIESTNLENLYNGLTSNNAIRELFLNFNCLGSNIVNIEFLSKALSINNSVELLNLSSNNLLDNKSSIEIIAGSIKNNNALKRLNMSGNNLKEKHKKKFEDKEIII